MARQGANHKAGTHICLKIRTICQVSPSVSDTDSDDTLDDKVLTSSAMTVNPLPASPARAASMEAFVATMLMMRPILPISSAIELVLSSAAAVSV
jgi:hypothetical protein